MTPGNVTCNTGAACGAHNITLTRATYGQRAVQLSIVTTARLTGLSYIVWEILCGKMDNKEGRGSPLLLLQTRAARPFANMFPFL